MSNSQSPATGATISRMRVLDSDFGQHKRAGVPQLGDQKSAASDGSSRAECVTVVVGQFDPLRTLGLMTMLRDSGLESVLEVGSDATALAYPTIRPRRLVAIMDAKTNPLLPLLDPSSGIIVLAREPSLPFGLLLSAAGVSCVDDATSIANILAAIRVTAQGGIFLSGADGHVERRDDSNGSLITDREIQVLGLLSAEISYTEIARDLSISAETVKKHTRHLLHKLGASSKRELAGLPAQWLNWRRGIELARPLEHFSGQLCRNHDC
jgi:DNA-binding NarL/FixJ family response regulator